MKKLPKISDAEWLVMNVVWKHPSCTAQEIIDLLATSNDWGPATVKTLINRLLNKKALTFEKTGKLYHYRAAVNEEDCRIAETKSLLDRVFDGSFSPMLAHFVKSKQLKPSEIAELEKILRKGKG